MLNQLKGCHLHTKTSAAGHLSTDTEIVAEFAAGAVSAVCEDDQTSGSCGALGGTSQ